MGFCKETDRRKIPSGGDARPAARHRRDGRLDETALPLDRRGTDITLDLDAGKVGACPLRLARSCFPNDCFRPFERPFFRREILYTVEGGHPE